MTSAQTWADPARSETLATLWREGFSARQIAKKMGLASRNVVIGRLYRLGLSNRDQPSASSKPKGGRPPGPRPRSIARAPSPPRRRKVAKAPPALRLGPNHSDTPKPPVIVPVDLWAPLEGLTHRPWTSRELSECKWPLDVGGEVHSCCRPVFRSGYCEAHAAIGFRTDTATKPRDYERSLRRFVA